MKHCLSILIPLFILNIGFTDLKAQEGINTSGFDAVGGSGSVSYSIGQLVYQKKTGTNGSVGEGVQQAFEISTLTGIAEALRIELSFLAYPNPTSYYLMLDLGDYPIQNVSFQLFDLGGSILESNTLEKSTTQINTANYAAGMYFLKVMESSKELKTFKIIKN